VIVTDITDHTSYPDCLRSQADEEGLTRSGGLHLTPIIRAIEQVIRPRDEWCTDEELSFFGAGGFMWERVFSEAFRDSVASGNLIRPGEIELDGITGSPDLLDLSDGVVGVETKLTWKSSRKLDTSSKPAILESLDKHFWAHKIQCLSYAKMLGINIYRLHYFFVAGDWRPPVPCVKAIQMEFSDRELDGNWGMITRFARDHGMYGGTL
jgi:hypothetical protein